MKVLIIRYSSLGDIVLTTPVMRLLKKQMNAEVHVLIKAEYESLLRHHRHIDKLFLREDTPKSLLKKESYDYVLDLQGNLRSKFLQLYLGTKTLTIDKMPIRKWLFLLLRINLLNRKHTADRNIEVLKKIGIHDDGYGLELFIPQTEWVVERKKYNRIVAIALGGTYVTKRIPKELALATAIDPLTHYILLGGKDVSLDNQDLSINVTNLVGKTDIEESVDILRQSDVIVTGDTGLMHIAAAYKKPIVVIWGSTSEEFGYYPYYGNNHHAQYHSVSNDSLTCNPCSKYGRKACPKKHMKCLNDLSASKVVKAINIVSRLKD